MSAANITDSAAVTTLPEPQKGSPGPDSRLRNLLDQPLVGFAPWVLLSLLEGPNRLVLAATFACGLALATMVIGLTVAVRPKILDVTAVGFFGLLAVGAAVADPALSQWLGVWAGELSAVAIAVIAGASILLRRPFTLQYARESTDSAYWATPLFLRINYVITGAWVAAFTLIAIVGYIGDGPLHQPDNLWTNWVIQIGLIVVAIKFTSWYPNYATAEVRGARRSRKARHADLFRPLAVYLVPVGILVMIIAGPAWWIGAIIMITGIVTTKKLHEAARKVDGTAD
jgi:hypothetical protein